MHFFLKQGQKICPNLLLNKKRIVQLINGKPGENRYNKITRETKPDAMHFDMVHVRATLGNPTYPPKPHKNGSYAVLDEKKGRTRSCISAQPAKNFEEVTKFPLPTRSFCGQTEHNPHLCKGVDAKEISAWFIPASSPLLRRSPPLPTLASPHPS
jgi:hypothetical protein